MIDNQFEYLISVLSESEPPRRYDHVPASSDWRASGVPLRSARPKARGTEAPRRRIGAGANVLSRDALRRARNDKRGRPAARQPGWIASGD